MTTGGHKVASLYPFRGVPKGISLDGLPVAGNAASNAPEAAPNGTLPVVRRRT
ncbi:hypothetical protein AB0H83_46570 [Dactylosporangium sp. NPDC050688]|uniref:hypothetical protein n=1 Tax=Dactylosporangium sp. NPDC050688 TaxID=3157217 RepID=UPI0033EC9C38